MVVQTLTRCVPSVQCLLSEVKLGHWDGRLSEALPLAHLMDSQLPGASRSDPVIILCAAFTLASVGVFACWLPARRATALAPVKAIRYELTEVAMVRREVSCAHAEVGSPTLPIELNWRYQANLARRAGLLNQARVRTELPRLLC